MVESGADVNIADNWQHTPLYYASRKGFSEIARILVMAGAVG